MKDYKLKKENVTINIMKFFGIFYVVLGHCISPNTLISKIIYFINLPLFFIISGYFFKDGEYKDKKEIFLYLGNKIGRFWKSYFIYGSLLVLFHNIFYKMQILDNVSYTLYNFDDFIFGIFNSALFISNELFSAAMWFIPVLIMGLTLFYTMQFYSKKFVMPNLFMFFLVLLSFIIGIYLNVKNINIGLHYHTSFYIIPFIYIGYLLRKYDILNKLNDKKVFLSIISIFILLIITWFVPGRPDIANNVLWNPIFYYISAILMFYLTYLLSNMIFKKAPHGIIKIFNYIGKHTISIMCLHLVFIKLYDYIYINLISKDFSILSNFTTSYSKFWIIYTLTGIIGPLLLEFIFIKLLNFKKNIV